MKRGEWQSLGRELIRLGLLGQSTEKFATVELTPDGLAALKSRRQITLTKPVAIAEKKARTRKGDIACDEVLFDRLRTLRRKLADERDVPAYIIFSDATLREVAPLLPRHRQRVRQNSRRRRPKAQRLRRILRGRSHHPPRPLPPANVRLERASWTACAVSRRNRRSLAPGRANRAERDAFRRKPEGQRRRPLAIRERPAGVPAPTRGHTYHRRQPHFFCESVEDAARRPRRLEFRCAKGHAKMSIIMAILHKLVRTAFAILKTGRPYQPDHVVATVPGCSPLENGFGEPWFPDPPITAPRATLKISNFPFDDTISTRL